MLSVDYYSISHAIEGAKEFIIAVGSVALATKAVVECVLVLRKKNEDEEEGDQKKV